LSTIRIQLLESIIQTLKNNTVAGNEVYYARDWPTDTSKLATGVILVFGLKERKERVRSGLLEYTTTATIDVLARVARGGPETTLKLVNLLSEQIAAAVICDLTIHKLTNYAPSVDIEIGMTSEGEMQIGQGLLSFSFEYRERYQPGGVPLVDIINGTEGSFGSFSVSLPQS
jgi:hypothetical protein